MKKLFEQYKDVIPYLFFGVCTTGVNVVTYWVMAHPLSMEVMPSTFVAWSLAVLFAYLTNRKWVFHSSASGSAEVMKELVSFFGCRIATGMVDWACMYLFVDIWAWDDVLVKLATNVLVIVLNYIASKLLIFKRGYRDKSSRYKG